MSRRIDEVIAMRQVLTRAATQSSARLPCDRQYNAADHEFVSCDAQRNILQAISRALRSD
jgi:hypothetical protein